MSTHSSVLVYHHVSAVMTETAVLELSSFYVADGYNSSNGSARLNLGGGRGTISTHDVQYISVARQELCESRGGRPALPVPSSPYGLCGRKATLNYCMFS